MPRIRCLAVLALALLTTLTGCLPDWFSRDTSTSAKAELAAPKLTELKTVGDYAAFVGVEPIQVHGVGVVQGLAGTGSNPPPGPMRQQAIRDLKRLGVEKPEEFLASKSAAVVTVSGWIWPGMRKDEAFDVEVDLQPDDKATSLKGGELIVCDLHEYMDANALRGRSQEGQKMLAHTKLAKAEGLVLLGVGEGGIRDERQRKGRVWGGGRCLKERGFDILLNRNSQSAGVAMAIAKSINDRYHSSDGAGKRVVAEALSSSRISLRMPDQYRHNWPRYLRCIRVMPMGQTQPLARALAEQLGQELQNPNQAIHAALQLEALGRESIPALKRGLSAMHPLSRFCAAEALAYLGDPACGEPLAELVQQHPEFRAYGLTALASLDEAVCHLKLRELMLSTNPETRYGAFRALKMLSPGDRYVQGEAFEGGFGLHRLASQSPSLVHVCSTQRPEVVIFGEEPKLQPPFSLRAGGDFIVTAKEGDDQCLVSRYSLRLGRTQKNCSLKTTEIVASLGKLGASYADVFDLLTQAADAKVLSGAFAVDALPQAQRLETARPEGAEGGDDLGETPNLFAKMGRLLSRGEAK